MLQCGLFFKGSYQLDAHADELMGEMIREVFFKML